MSVNVKADLRINPFADAQLKDLTRRELGKIATRIKNKAQQLAPVDTGALKSSIHQIREKDTLIIATDTGYGGFVEIGTSRMRAQPYLRPAIAQVKGEIDAGRVT